MMKWLDRQLASLSLHGEKPKVIVDPNGLLDATTTSKLGSPQEVKDYLTLRRAWMDMRGIQPPGVIVVQSPDFPNTRSLPWDVEQRADTAVIRWPVPPEWQSLARELSAPLFDLLVDLVDQDPHPSHVVIGLLQQGFGVVFPAPTAGVELDGVARLVTSGRVPTPLWEYVRPFVRGELARSLCQQPPDIARLQSAWAEWLAKGEDATYGATLQDASTGVMILLAAGLLRPEPLTAEGLPRWTQIGAIQPSKADQAAMLLDSVPSPWPPETEQDWITVAMWWGDLRAALAEASPVPPDLSRRAYEVWHELDGRFLAWLQSRYSLLFSSARPYPLTLHQVAPFLSRRYAATRRHQLLMVMDGMGFAQWSQMRAAVTVVEAAGCFALCPTLTSVSRQAIFAGAVPLTFPESLWTTNHEEVRWRAFWEGEGVSRRDVRYLHTPGALLADVPNLGNACVVGMVVSAVDELLHGADVLGDAQVSAGINTWLRHGFLEAAVRHADQKGFDIWVTADQGNIEAIPSGRVMEGPLVEQAGTRVRLYENKILRDNAKAEGISWDPPGLPEEEWPLFAPGRTGYHSGSPRVSHGGLSLDEVIVPFMRVVPR